MPNDSGDCSLAPHDQPREHRLWDLALIQRPLWARFFGAGGIGLCAIAAAATVDAHLIVAVDVIEDKLAFARRFGATHTINAQEVDAVKAIRELTDGGVEYGIDAIGLPQTQEQILRSVRAGYAGFYRGGIALLIGITPPGAQAILDTNLFVGNRSFTRTSGGDCRPERDFPVFIRWYREGKLKLNDLVTHRYSLDQINTAVDDLEHGRILRSRDSYLCLIAAN